MTQDKKTSPLEAFALYSQLGFILVAPIVLGALSGSWLDRKLGTGIIFFMILVCLGIAAGIAVAYKQINTVFQLKKPKKKK